MKKTHNKAVIGQLNRQTGKYTHIERRVYEDEHGKRFVKINGDPTSIIWLLTHDRTVKTYYAE